VNEALLQDAGFTIEGVDDRTENMARNAGGWLAARATREKELKAIEGEATFEGQQRFLETAAMLAREWRLSRVAIVARRHRSADCGRDAGRPPLRQRRAMLGLICSVIIRSIRRLSQSSRGAA
jgi:hypothetical protein